MARLIRRAGFLGITPQEYIRHLIEEDLHLERKARTTSFAEIMGPARRIDESDLDRIVDEARRRHHHSPGRGGR
jgi:hypothetical protein